MKQIEINYEFKFSVPFETWLSCARFVKTQLQIKKTNDFVIYTYILLRYIRSIDTLLFLRYRCYISLSYITFSAKELCTYIFNKN